MKFVLFLLVAGNFVIWRWALQVIYMLVSLSFSVATVEIASADSGESGTAYYEAMKTDIESAMNRLRTSMNDRLKALQDAGESARASALKAMSDGVAELQKRLESFAPTSKTGQMLLDGIKSTLKSLESTFNNDFKNWGVVGVWLCKTTCFDK